MCRLRKNLLLLLLLLYACMYAALLHAYSCHYFDAELENGKKITDAQSQVVLMK